MESEIGIIYGLFIRLYIQCGIWNPCIANDTSHKSGRVYVTCCRLLVWGCCSWFVWCCCSHVYKRKSRLPECVQICIGEKGIFKNTRKSMMLGLSWTIERSQDIVGWAKAWHHELICISKYNFFRIIYPPLYLRWRKAKTTVSKNDYNTR